MGLSCGGSPWESLRTADRVSQIQRCGKTYFAVCLPDGTTALCLSGACSGMRIDSYQFGKIVIDGTAYYSDLIVFAYSVKPNRRRIFLGRVCDG